jgi:hypothetical protein
MKPFPALQTKQFGGKVKVSWECHLNTGAQAQEGALLRFEEELLLDGAPEALLQRKHPG